MGWTGTNAEFYKNGKVDRKKEIDHYLGEENVLESSMVGSTYFAAMRGCGKEKDIVFGVVCLTSVDNSDYYNFNYKLMDETEGPGIYNCPLKILKLLTPTTSEFANNWRNNCYKYHEKRRLLTRLTVGTKIIAQVFNDTYHLTLEHWKNGTKWIDWNKNVYIKKSDLLNYAEFEVQ